MAEVSKRYKLVNPGRRRRNASKRKLSPLQKLFFGSKRQRAAVRLKKNPRKRSVQTPRKYGSRKFRRAAKTGSVAKADYYRKRYEERAAKHNVGSIVTVWPAGMNPGRKKRNAARKNRKPESFYYKVDKKTGKTKKVYTYRSPYRKSNKGKRIVVINKGEKMARKRSNVSRRRRRHTRRHRNVVYRGRVKRGMYKYSSNPGRRRHRHHRNPSMRRRSYRRNPGMLSGTAGRVIGVFGGIALTKLLNTFIPAQFSTGVLGYFATGLVAVAQGKLVGKVAKNAALGNDFMVGGMAYLLSKLLNDFFPSIGSYSGISGMGMIGGSSFYVPQVNTNGSMATFQVPAAVMGAIPPPVAPASGNLGRLRRTGRLM